MVNRCCQNTITWSMHTNYSVYGENCCVKFILIIDINCVGKPKVHDVKNKIGVGENKTSKIKVTSKFAEIILY